ncbi:hypothetical protein BH11BAC4_BH11BAC4_14940 [soil metagenome]
MELTKQEKIITSLLINIQTEILTLKDFVLTNIAGNEEKSERMDYLTKLYETTRKLYQNEVLIQIKNRHDDNLGTIEDLLNNL